MTEADWATCYRPNAMLRVIRKTARPRKFQLLLCGVCRLAWPYIPNELLRDGVEAYERFADGLLEPDEFLRIQRMAMTAGVAPLGVRTVDYSPSDLAAYLVQAALSADSQNIVPMVLEWGQGVFRLAVPIDQRAAAERRFDVAVCELIRELFPPDGRKYMPVPSFLGGGVVLTDGRTFRIPESARAIAAGVLADQAFDRLPILADALEDADLNDRPWLDHLRFGTGHRRGCWAIDAVLGQ